MGELCNEPIRPEEFSSFTGSKRDYVDLVDECGITASASMLNVTPYALLQGIIDKNRSLYLDLCANYQNGLDYKQLIDIVLVLEDQIRPDMRYNYGKRVLKGHIFKDTHRGLIAIKFVGKASSHWCAVKDGCVVDSENIYKTIEELRSGFDGFGHNVLFREARDLEVIQNIESFRCKGDCSVCFRINFCLYNTNKTLEDTGIRKIRKIK